MTDQENVAPAILFVDDEATAVKYFQRAIGSLAPVATAGSVEEGKRMLEMHVASIKVLVSDQRMPGAYGNELLEFAKLNYPDVVRILTTAYSEIDHLVDAVNQGQIYRYLQKPWEITALRMELKQALDMANLRNEHSQLLREKLTVRQRQLLANRIGSLYAVCVNAAPGRRGAALEVYLHLAHTFGVQVPESNWETMDYADVVGIEAFRQCEFEAAVKNAFAEICSKHGAATDKLAVLRAELGVEIGTHTPTQLWLADGKSAVAYLESPSGAAISNAQVQWLACLIWLDAQGASLQAEADVADGGWCCTLGEQVTEMSPRRLATWIDNLI